MNENIPESIARDTARLAASAARLTALAEQFERGLDSFIAGMQPVFSALRLGELSDTQTDYNQEG